MKFGNPIAALGLLVAALGFLSALTTSPDLPEVQAIYYVAAILGFILMALGMILRRIEAGQR